MAKRFYAFYDSDGLGIYQNYNRARNVADKCFDCPVVKGFDHFDEARRFAVDGYNRILRCEDAESGFFPEESYISVNYVYFRRELC